MNNDQPDSMSFNKYLQRYFPDVYQSFVERMVVLSNNEITTDELTRAYQVFEKMLHGRLRVKDQRIAELEAALRKMIHLDADMEGMTISEAELLIQTTIAEARRVLEGGE